LCVLYGGLVFFGSKFSIFDHQNPGFGTGSASVSRSGSGSAIRKNAGSGSALNQCGSTTLMFMTVLAQLEDIERKYASEKEHNKIVIKHSHIFYSKVLENLTIIYVPHSLVIPYLETYSPFAIYLLI
jgi:hypothetical protein